MSRRGDRDRGGADVLALVMVTPAVLAVALLVVFLGRQVDAQAQVRAVAESAAQAAALERTPVTAAAAARHIVERTLVDADTCVLPEVHVDLGSFAAGGAVAVTVTCEVSVRGIEGVGVAGRRFSATAHAAVDPYREARP